MKKLIIEPTPHIRSRNQTSTIMLHVIIATVPSIIASVILFGARAALLIITCICACVAFEYFFRRIFKRGNTIHNLSAVVTGILLAFNLPVTLPLYAAIIGCFAAIVVTKEMFGGLGQNFANPAIVGRIVLMVSFPSYFSSYVAPFYYKDTPNPVDAVTAATPLALEKTDGAPKFLDLFFGNHAGCIGETCSVLLLLGLAYLIVMRIIRPITTLTFIGTVVVCTFLAGGDPVFTIFSGGVLLGAIFMATDYVTNPMTAVGKLIFGFGCGLITFVIRQFGGMPEGVAFAILTMNILTPLIDKFTMPKPFGVVPDNEKENPKE